MGEWSNPEVTLRKNRPVKQKPKVERSIGSHLKPASTTYGSQSFLTFVTWQHILGIRWCYFWTKQQANNNLDRARWSGLVWLVLTVLQHNRLYHAIGLQNILCRATVKQWNNRPPRNILRHCLCGRSSRQIWLGFLRGVFLANHLASTDNLTRTTKIRNTYQRKITIQKGP